MREMCAKRRETSRETSRPPHHGVAAGRGNHVVSNQHCVQPINVTLFVQRLHEMVTDHVAPKQHCVQPIIHIFLSKGSMRG